MNKRVQDADGFRGSVRYEGPIQAKNAPTVYWGVDWDDPSRGKHNGESGGVRYFEAAHPTSASFVLPEKVSLGIGILEALHERYMQSEELDTRAAGHVGTASGSSKPIQLVGVRKIQEKQDLGVIGKVSVEGSQVSHIGNKGELFRVAPNIVELNLGFNLLSSWSEVLKLSSELPQLEHLILSGNVLAYDVDTSAPLVVFPTVQVLVMNQTRTSWTDLLRICRDHFPALRELHAASNGLTDDALRAAATSPLEVVDLSHNQLTDWSSVAAAVGSWPRLHTLSLNGNNVAQILPPSPSALFAHLASLSLSDNALVDWASIDALNAFPSLESLRLTKNPLLTNVGAAEARMLVVARCASIKVFNSSDIRPKERHDAEQMYLKRILHEQATVPALSDPTVLLAHHPRFPHLQALYPDICAAHDAATKAQSAGGATTGPAALSKSLAKVTFVPMSMNATTMDTMVKSLPLSMKVAQVKAMVEKKYGLPPSEHQLSFRASKKAMPVPLDDDDGELGYFGVQDGGELLINDIW